MVTALIDALALVVGDRQPYVSTVTNASGSVEMLPRSIHHNMLVANYAGSVGGVDNDDGSKQYLRHHNFNVFGGIKERGVAEQATHSLYAWVAGDIAESEGGNGKINKTSMPRLNMPKRIANNTIVLGSAATTVYHICAGWEGNAFDNQLFGAEHADVTVRGPGCCSDCNVSCCTSNCTKNCTSTSFTLEEWQQQNPALNDLGTTLTHKRPTSEWIVAQARAMLMLPRQPRWCIRSIRHKFSQNVIIG
eukprot:COSAG01_NODE_970_length_12375_cov_27.268736_6_plen_248_part_00